MFIGVNPSTDNFQVALIATPSALITDGNTADMGAGFYIPTGLNIGNFLTGNSNIPASEWISQSLGSGNANGDPYFISRIEAGASSILLNGDEPFELVLFDIIADPNPTSGSITFVENGDPVFDFLFIENYININLGGGTINAYSQNDPSANSIEFSTLGLDEFLDLESHISIYPNPTSNYIRIATKNTVIKNIELFDNLGKQIIAKTISNKLDLRNYKSGIYFLKVSTDNGSITKKIVVK